MQVLMGVLQVGQVFSVLLSHMITSAFTTSVAFLVLTSQLKNVLGITVPRHFGPFKTIYVSPCIEVLGLEWERRKREAVVMVAFLPRYTETCASACPLSTQWWWQYP